MPYRLSGIDVRNLALLALVLALLALKAQLITLHNVNWDEFLYLAKIYSAQRGDLYSPLQTIYVHAFGWLPHVAGNEVDQIVAARGVMLLLHGASCGLIYLTGRKLFGSVSGALLAVLAYLSFSYTVDHGTAFRADPIAGFLLMLALWLIVLDRGTYLVLAFAALLTALAGMVTIKSVFYVPTLALAVMYLRRAKPMRARVGELAIFGVATISAFAVLYVLHRLTLDIPHDYSPVRMASRSAEKVALQGEWFPAMTYLDYTLRHDTLAWLLLLGGIILAIAVSVRARAPGRATGLLGLTLPVLTLAFYRNAFPYYYVFMLAGPAVLIAGLGAWAEAGMSRRRKTYSTILLGGIACILGANVFARHARMDDDRTRIQRQVLGAVHQIFAQPVPYLDRVPSIPSFPKAGFFMSSWGMENYADSGVPVMRRLIVEQRPVFLVSNMLGLMRERRVGEEALTLLAEDAAVLRDNYVHHWGSIWVAGKHLDPGKDDQAQTFEILIPGSYTLEGEGTVGIDGMERAPGSVIELAAGLHTLRATGSAGTVTLRWGINLHRPTEQPIKGPLYLPFIDMT